MKTQATTNDSPPFLPSRAGIVIPIIPLAFLALAGTAAAHEGESAGPWIDFSQYGFGGMSEVPNVHPAFVHFPIALIPTMFAFYCLGIWMKKPALIVAGKITLWLATLALAIVVYTGMAARSTAANEAIEKIMGTHKNTGFVLLGIAFILALWSLWTKTTAADAERPLRAPRASMAFLVLAAFASYLVLQNADLGSRMVYLHGAGVKPMVREFQIQNEGSGH